MNASTPIDARTHADTDTDVAAASQAAELVRHPGHAARSQARWSEWRATAERLHAAVRPRFVTTVLLLGGAMALLAALAVALSWPAP
ncbi:MAG: hypothetical protein JNN03_23035 [Rubrivivax sp.]|nr:hypothetical protein [Rubrivivax sp.]